MNAKVLAIALALGAVLATVSAECPNACSGHGECQSFRDFCLCYKGYQGNDCSQRTCAFGLGWIDIPQGDLNHDNAKNGGYSNRLADNWNRPKGTGNLTALNPMWRPYGWYEQHPSQLYGTNGQTDFSMRQLADEGHFYAECSNRGICDRDTGLCQCFTGYEGTACNRTVCANQCSGHGICESIREKIASSDSDVNDYMLWDADKTYGCQCDPEYFGNDCSKRRCYRNDDPLTSMSTTKWKSEKLSEQGETQIVKVACANQGEVITTSTFKLTYTDVQFGEMYTTAAYTVGGHASDAAAAADLKAKLEALPNQVLNSHADNAKIDSVTRDVQTTPLGGTVYRYFINFNHRLGNVPTLSIDNSGVSCKAGIVLPAGYKTDTWRENIGIQLEGNGPTEDTTVQLRIAKNTTSNFHQFNYKIFSGSETSASSSWSSARMFPEDSASYLPLDRTHETSTLSPLGDNLLKAKFLFPNGPEAENVDSTRTSVEPDAAHSATETYEIQFKAPSVSTSVFTQMHNISETLPIAYVVENRPVSTRTGFVRELMYVEYTSPFQTHWVSENFTITKQASETDEYDWSASWSGNSGSNVDFGDDWNFLSGATGTDKYLIYKFQFGATSHASRGAAAADWKISAFPGHVSSSGGSEDELLFLAWTDSTNRPVEALDYVVSITAPGSGASNSSRYQWSLNGVNMGEYSVAAGFNQLGGADGAGYEAGMIRVRFMHETFSFDRTVEGEDYRSWKWSMLKNPVQNNWAYAETLRVHYRSDADGAQVTPSKNLAIVINVVTTAGAVDTYRWKLSDDEVWYGEGSGSGSDFSDDPFQLADASTHTNSAAELQKLVFWFSAGADATGLGDDPARACDTSVNSRYYVQLGKEGVNDFPTCSDRGICDEESGECKCFKGYAGQDCSEQHALSL